MKLRYAPCAIAAFMHIACPAAAQDINGIFCPGMSDAALYEKNGFDSYKILVPGTDGWIYRSGMDLKQNFSLDREALHNLGLLNDILADRGITLVMLLIPTRGMMHDEHVPPELREQTGYDPRTAWKSYWKAVQDLRAAGIVVAGIRDVGEGNSFFYKRDHHWNQDGAALAARIVADHVKELKAYDSIPRKKFVTRDGEARAFFGVFKKVFRKICGTEQPPENITIRHTEPANAASGENDLFGDAPPPRIVLLGTSNSTQKPSYSNFEGFLKQELSADILNMSESGGGLETAMLRYFSTDHYRDMQGRIAVWEIPVYYELSNYMSFFREVIPAAQGACDSPVARAGGVEIDDKTVVALSRLGDKGIEGGKYYARLEFSRPPARPFKVSLRYHKRGKDEHRVSPVSEHLREFFVSLDGDKSSPLDKVMLTGIPPAMKGAKVDVSICAQPVEVASHSGAPSRGKKTAAGRGLIGKLKNLQGE